MNFISSFFSKAAPVENQVNWDKLITSDNANIKFFFIAMIKQANIPSCPYKKIFLKHSVGSTVDPIFSDDGVFRDWNNKKNLKGEEVLLVYFPISHARSDLLERTASSLPSNALGEKKDCVPEGIHVKLIRFLDYHGFFTESLSQAAIECLSTAKHNLNPHIALQQVTVDEYDTPVAYLAEPLPEDQFFDPN